MFSIKNHLFFSRLQSTAPPISVHYLSPLVLRKELENIIDTPDPNNSPLYHMNFMEKHLILFWNLVRLIEVTFLLLILCDKKFRFGFFDVFMSPVISFKCFCVPFHPQHQIIQ